MWADCPDVCLPTDAFDATLCELCAPTSFVEQEYARRHLERRRAHVRILDITTVHPLKVLSSSSVCSKLDSRAEISTLHLHASTCKHCLCVSLQARHPKMPSDQDCAGKHGDDDNLVKAQVNSPICCSDVR